MPLVFVFLYFALEALAFYAVARWIGVGWALLAMFALMLLGGTYALSQLRSILKKPTLSAAGDLGLTFAGAVLNSVPGFITGLFGLLLIFPPTRAFFRGYAAGQLTKLGTQVYVRTQPTENYGSFVIDEDPHP